MGNINNQSKTNEFSADMTIGEVIERYPAIKSWLPSLSDNYKTLSNPLIFKIMANKATLDIVAQRGSFTTEELIRHLNGWVAEHQGDE